MSLADKYTWAMVPINTDNRIEDVRMCLCVYIICHVYISYTYMCILSVLSTYITYSSYVILSILVYVIVTLSYIFLTAYFTLNLLYICERMYVYRNISSRAYINTLKINKSA